ncbi:MAG: hypothetical protein Q8S14_01380 [Algoriphagus sp.]|uniref:hypothetical protein n=1 Tax=Algoriphagus sp. TaxID=1872435 RepID=UPI00272F45BC|nr:hypothetical protein [Algoriphagus sp.]MDP2042860.1 hypothetical protein [Algoriphagus sp.]MDP3470496.1 hypothetical protein [Algoriphagus sp.]
MKTILTIEKENISNLSFSKAEVIPDPDGQKKRMADLYRSQTLGNLLHTKVKITFEAADQQIYMVDTTVWAVGNSFVSLKGGVFLPIRSILQVD